MADKRNMETKTFPALGVKVINEAQGIVEHVITVFGVYDNGGDISHPGSFRKTLAERGNKVRVVDSHNYGSVLNAIGKPLEIREIGRGDLPPDVLTEYPEATGGVWARTQFLMDTPEGKGAFIRLKEGAVDEWSYGYDALDVDYSKMPVNGDEVAVRNLRSVRLWEYSPVLWGMNPATTTLSAKDDAPGDGGEDKMTDKETDIKAGEESTDEKTVSGSTNLPLADRERAWDATAAERRVRAWAGAEDAPNAKYRGAFFWYDAENADTFGAYKLGFADVFDGGLKAVPRAVFAVAAVLQGGRGGVDIPSGDADKVKSRVAGYYARMRSEFDDDGIVPPWEKAGQGADDTKEAADVAPDEPDNDAPKTDDKAGRVLAARNASRIGAALQAIIDVLEDAGVDIPGFSRAEPEKDEDDEKAAEMEVVVTSTAPEVVWSTTATEGVIVLDEKLAAEFMEYLNQKASTAPDEQVADEQKEQTDQQAGPDASDDPPTSRNAALLKAIDIELGLLEVESYGELQRPARPS